MKTAQRTILLVEDELVISRNTQDAIEFGLGHLVIPFRDGRSAIEAIDDDLQFDLALVDLSLEDIEGKEVIKRIKDKYPSKPVIAASCYPVAKFRETRADDFYRDKGDHEELFKLIKEYLT